MRSGTTFLVDKLAKHPQLLKIGSELNEIWTDIGHAPMKGCCPHLTEKDFSVDATYQMTNYISNFINESKSIKRHLMRLNTKLDNDLGRFSYDWDSIIPVNKSPHIMNKISYVNSLFHDSKFILIVRDIYAHSSSMKIHFDNQYKKNNLVHVMDSEAHSCWSDVPADSVSEKDQTFYPSDFSLIPKMWLRLNKTALEEIKLLPEKNRLIISYEKLINNEPAELKKVFAFLDLKDEHKKWEDEIRLSKQKLINTTTKGNPLDKWKTQLSEDEKSTITEMIKDNQDTYNYIMSHFK